jgi:hypothetical protein
VLYKFKPSQTISLFIKRDWKRMSNNLVKRGSIFVDFLDNWEKEVEKTNRVKMHKRGRKFTYPDALFYLTAFLNTLLGSRQVEGILSGLSKLKNFPVPDYSTTPITRK